MCIPSRKSSKKLKIIFYELVLVVILMINHSSNSVQINSNKGHAAGVSDTFGSSSPSLPDISKHKNFNLLGSTSDCGIYSIKKRILNGEKTDLFEFPWMALLLKEEDDIDNTAGFYCAGTVINDRYILTTSSCINNRGFRPSKVRVGEYNRTSDPDCETEGEKISVCADPIQDIEIEDTIPHPRHSPRHKNNDIGLLRLRTPIQFKRSVRPICLPTITEFKNFTDTTLIVTGWGTTSAYDVSTSDYLLKAEVSVVSEQDCKQIYNKSEEVNIDHTCICAGGPKGDTCQGDSGGPLQGAKLLNNDLQYVQFGITSFGGVCGKFPGVYTRIDYYMDWILDNIKA